MNYCVGSCVLLLAAVLPAQASPLTSSAKTEHFEVFYRPESRAGAAVDRVAALAERELERICGQLGVEVSGSFELHLYDSVEELTKITGVKGSAGFSSGNASHIPFGNDQTRYHEMVHIVAYNLLEKSGEEARNLFFAEGLANACLEFVHGVPVHAVAKYYRDLKVLPSLAEMTRPLDFYAWLRARSSFNAYDVAGSYMLFLLQEYGAEKTTRYYSGATAKDALGVGEKQVERLWHEALDRFEMRAELAALMRKRHEGSASMLLSLRRPAGLPAELLGKPEEWRSLNDENLRPDKNGKWGRTDGGIVGKNRTNKWSVCELGVTKFADCVVRATIHTEQSTPIQIRLGRDNQAMLVNGTFLYRGDRAIEFAQAPSMNVDRKKTDLVLVRRKGKMEIWVDGRLAISNTVGEDVASPVGIAIHRGGARFENVRVRKLD